MELRVIKKIVMLYWVISTNSVHSELCGWSGSSRCMSRDSIVRTAVMHALDISDCAETRIVIE